MWQWLVRLFRRRGSSHKKSPFWPSAEHIEQLPWFESLTLNDVIVAETEAAARRAYDELAAEIVVGFDTESRPTFVRGQVSDGPHVAQFSTRTRAFVFPLREAGVRAIVGEIMKLPTLTKVGFGLRDDIKRIHKKLRVEPAAVIDIGTLFAQRGYKKQEVGVKVAMALVFKQRFRKSKRVATSNWNVRRLSSQQVLYAANDAYAAIHIYDELNA